MSYKAISDNIYAEGTLIAAKEDPSVKLKIARYYKRIYYCSIVGDEDRKQLVYYERELIPPTKVNENRISIDSKQNALNQPGEDFVSGIKSLRSSLMPNPLVLTRSSKKFEVVNRVPVGTPITF